MSFLTLSRSILFPWASGERRGSPRLYLQKLWHVQETWGEILAWGLVAADVFGQQVHGKETPGFSRKTRAALRLVWVACLVDTGVLGRRGHGGETPDFPHKIRRPKVLAAARASLGVMTSGSSASGSRRRNPGLFSQNPGGQRSCPGGLRTCLGGLSCPGGLSCCCGCPWASGAGQRSPRLYLQKPWPWPGLMGQGCPRDSKISSYCPLLSLVLSFSLPEMEKGKLSADVNKVRGCV